MKIDKGFESIICMRIYLGCRDIELLIYQWAMFFHFLDLYQGVYKKNDICYRCNKKIDREMGKYCHHTFYCIQKGDSWDLMFNRTYDFIFGIDLKEGYNWRKNEEEVEKQVFKLENKKLLPPNLDFIVLKLGNY